MATNHFYTHNILASTPLPHLPFRRLHYLCPKSVLTNQYNRQYSRFHRYIYPLNNRYWVLGSSELCARVDGYGSYSFFNLKHNGLI